MRRTGVGWGGKETTPKKFGNKIKKKKREGRKGRGGRGDDKNDQQTKAVTGLTKEPAWKYFCPFRKWRSHRRFRPLNSSFIASLSGYLNSSKIHDMRGQE